MSKWNHPNVKGQGTTCSVREAEDRTFRVKPSSANGAPLSSLGRRPREQAEPPRAGSTTQRGSIPGILLMQRHTVSLTKRAHLLLKITLRVMRLLFVDITHQGMQVRWPDRKQTISTLPRKLCHAMLLHPHRRRGLQLRDRLRCRFGGTQPQRKMHVIHHTTGSKAIALQPSCGPGQVAMQTRRDLFTNQGHPALGAEDHVNHVQGQRLRHGAPHVPGFQPYSFAQRQYLGLRPRLLCSRAFSPSTPLVQTPMRGHHPATGAYTRVRHTEAAK